MLFQCIPAEKALLMLNCIFLLSNYHCLLIWRKLTNCDNFEEVEYAMFVMMHDKLCLSDASWCMKLSFFVINKVATYDWPIQKFKQFWPLVPHRGQGNDLKS